MWLDLPQKLRQAQNYRNKVRNSKLGPRILAAILGFCTVFALSYVTTNTSRHQRFPHPSSCPTSFRSSLQDHKSPKLHILLLSYPRSGSSFLGDLLQSYRGAFYHFEPLHYFGNVVSRSQLSSARKLLHDLLICDYRDWASFPEWAWFNSDFLTLRRNKRYWDLCTSKDQSRLLCYNICFLGAACHNSSVQIIKTIRMAASEAGKLLEEYPDLNLKVIHLVRDPRGTMNSRQQKDIAVWCNKYKACSSPDTFCRMVDDDLQNACQLQNKYPNKYTLVRYEDLALDPPRTTEKLFQFLGIAPVPAEVSQFLETHTQGTHHTQGTQAVTTNSFLQPPYRTVRNSTQAALEWCRKMDNKLVHSVQTHCRTVLDKLGYKLVHSKPDLTVDDVLNTVPHVCNII